MARTFQNFSYILCYHECPDWLHPALHTALHSVTRRVGREASSGDRDSDFVMLLLHTTVPVYMG
jgi:hypothetical protein